MKSTDLEEVTWKSEHGKFSLKLHNAQPAHQVISQTTLEPALAPCIGIFRFAKPGKTNLVKEGMKVKKGHNLGLVEAGKNFKTVTAAQDGFVKIVCVEDGKAVEYGQPLFFIEPK